jgi:hypothetical protein
MELLGNARVGLRDTFLFFNNWGIRYVFKMFLAQEVTVVTVRLNKRA